MEDVSWIDDLAHELRTPLTPMMLLVHLLEEHPDMPPSLIGHVRMLRENIEGESRLLDDLLDLCRCEQGRLRLDRAPLDLDAAMSDAIALASSELERTPVIPRLEVAGARIDGDRPRLIRMIGGLIVAAGGRAPADTPVTVATTEEGGQVAITISDRSQTDAAALASALNVAGWSSNRVARGFGTRLTSAVVALHGGSVSVASTPGSGTQVTLLLPRHRGDAGQR
ncbi:MAG: HAMP domain-containing histidine kinase [Planctomycetes bacterium]|nr:HAMP domain-containing histidine kinase [Planctomycetota bacterium]